MKVAVCLGRRRLIPAVIGLLAILMVSGSTVFAVAGVTNGDFESSGTGWGGLGPGNNSTNQFNVVVNTGVPTTLTKNGTTITPQHGTHFAEMDSITSGQLAPQISQTMTLLPGSTITGFYWFIPDSGGTPNASAAAQVNLLVSDPAQINFCSILSTLTPVNTTAATGAWVQFTQAIPANATSSMWELDLILSCPQGFFSQQCNNAAAAFDNIQYTPPPPATTTTAAQNAMATYSGAPQNVTLNATITAGSTVNEGTVTFTVKQGANTIGVAATSGTVTSNNASAQYSLPGGTGVGPYTITAVYNPALANPNFATSTSSPATLTVNKANTSETVPNLGISFSATAQNVTLSATVNSTTPVNEGTVKFSVRQGVSMIIGSSVTSGTVTNGAASVTYSIPGGTPVGGYSIDAVYNAAASNPNFQGLTGNSGTLNINPNPPLVTGLTNPDFESGVTGWQGFGTGGSNTQFNVIVHASVATTLTKGGTTITPQSNGHFGELDSITSGNAPAVIYQNISVLPGGTLSGYYYFVPDSGAGANANAALQIELIACDPNGPPPCTPAFPTVSAFPVNITTGTNGWVPFSFTFPANQPFTTWSLNLILNCPSGGTTEKCANAAAAFDNFVYTLPTTTTTVTNTTTPYSATAQNVTLNATVSSASPVNEGTVTFTVTQGATTIGTPVTSGTVTNGAASVTYALPANTSTGPYTMSAVFNIAPTNAKFQASSGSGTLTVIPDATTIAVTNAAAPVSATTQNVTLNAAVTSTSAVNEGTVTFTVTQGATTIGAPVTSGTVASGLASVTYALPGNTAAGAYTITAVYNPAASPAKFQTSTGTGTLTVGAGSLIGLSVSAPSNLGSPPALKVGQQAPLTATATLSGSPSRDVTNQSQWSSDNTNVLKVDPATGVIIGQSAGTAKITATYTLNGVTKTGSIMVSVTPPNPLGINIPPAPSSRSSGTTSEPVTIPGPLPNAPPTGGPTAPAPAPVPTAR